MPHSPEEKRKVLARVKRIRGQLEALEKALENEVECRAVLQQIAAIRGATNGLMAEVLESHIRETFSESGVDNAVNQSVNNTLELIRTYLK